MIRFCDEIFAGHGAVFCGPGGGRFVYELRRRFDLYCKMAPLQPFAALRDTGVLRPDAVEGDRHPDHSRECQRPVSRQVRLRAAWRAAARIPEFSL